MSTFTKDVGEVITDLEAGVMMGLWQAEVGPNNTHKVFMGADAFEAMLSQAGATGVWAIMCRDQLGNYTVSFQSGTIDGSGQGAFFNKGNPCPPNCGTA